MGDATNETFEAQRGMGRPQRGRRSAFLFYFLLWLLVMFLLLVVVVGVGVGCCKLANATRCPPIVLWAMYVFHPLRKRLLCFCCRCHHPFQPHLG